MSDEDLAVNVINPSSGTTIALADFHPVYVNNTGPLAALTFQLPPSPTTSDYVDLSFLSPVSALVIQDSAGNTIGNMPTNAFGPGAALRFRYCAAGWVYWK